MVVISFKRVSVLRVAANCDDMFEPNPALFEALWRSMVWRLMPKTLLITEVK
jgi:hypothetical protein